MSQRERLPTDILGLLSGTVAFPGTAGSSLPDLAELKEARRILPSLPWEEGIGVWEGVWGQGWG